MEKIRIGVVGVGHLGSIHAKVYSRIDNVKLVRIFYVAHDFPLNFLILLTINTNQKVESQVKNTRDYLF